MCRWISGLERCEVAGFSNIAKAPQRCKEAKLHGAQALQPLKITNVQVWKKIKLQGSQTEMVHLYCAAKTKKLQGTQTQETQSDARHRVWKKIKLHGTQTHATLWWKITEPSNSVTRSYGALEKGKIAWYSNISCMANQISPLWRRVKSYGSQINRAQYFCVHFNLKGTKKS